MMLFEWAKQWGVPLAAIHDLQARMGVRDLNYIPDPQSQRFSETRVTAEVRLEASELGHRLWRNNVGAFYDRAGNLVRCGLCNDSEKLNKLVKSHDLIGIRQRLITPDMVGTVIGQFMSREVKKSDWHYSGDEHEVAQLAFAEIVLALGGDAAFAVGRGTI